jgi:uncharacterized protein (DUF58 family)
MLTSNAANSAQMADPVISAALAPAAGNRYGFMRFEIPEVWMRFLLALLGLILAFTAALFSTVTRESGSLWGTVILASIALALAVVVGLTTVPYLARRVAGGRVRDAFNYDVTGVGIIYVLTVLLIGVAALNTGNNLLYVIVAAMLAAIMVSGIASAIVLRELELDIRVPEHVFAGSATLGKIVVRNRRKWLPSFSISVVPVKTKTAAQWQWVATTFGFPPGHPVSKQWVRLPDRQLRRVANVAAASPGIFTESAYFPYIPPAAELSAELELCFPRRGRYQQNTFGLATRFPFAFLTKTRRVPLSREILVYPAIDTTDEFFEVLPVIAGEFESFARGRGDDLYLIREYMPEDSARHVDWKATAKSGSLKVREFSREDERKLRLIFDNPAPGTVSEQAYENAVTAAASLGWHFAESTAELSFVAQGCKREADVHDFLAYLATVGPQGTTSVLDDLEFDLENSGGYNVIFTTRLHADIPAHLRDCSYFIFIGAV